MSVPRIVTLLTDFGDADAYVGVMKGVLLRGAQDARLVDLTHRIPPQDVHAAAYVLETAVDWFPSKTVHLVVVDPGVGSDRATVAVRTARGFFVAPDNGVLTAVLEEGDGEAFLLDTEGSSVTFHGRDVLAPAAAHLARGWAIEDLGPRAEGLVSLPDYRPRRDGDRLLGRVLHVDRFGNAITSIRRGDLIGDRLEVLASGVDTGPLRMTYSEVAPGATIALLGSSDHLEIAVREGSAAAILGLRSGDEIVVRGE